MNVKRRGGAWSANSPLEPPTAHSPRGGDPGVLGETQSNSPIACAHDALKANPFIPIVRAIDVIGARIPPALHQAETGQ